MQVIHIEELLLEKINVKKNMLIHYASQFDLTDERVVKCSQELDKLLNQYQLREKKHLLDLTSQTETEMITIGKGELRWEF